MSDCRNCLYRNYDEEKTPCSNCNNFENYVSDVMVNPVQREEINHPDRYAGGKYECIDVMQDVFGVEAVKHFCMLNAFKYIWRSEKKNGVEDVQKAVWYLNKCIELVESEGEKE